MEDELRPEYDLKSLRVRKLGSERKSFGNSKIPSNIEDEINSIIEILQKPFVSRRNKLQNQLINVKKTTNWKIHQRYFIFGFILLFIASTVAFYFATVLFNIDKIGYRNFVIALIFLSIFLLLFSAICLHLWLFSSVFGSFKTYQDELKDIKRTVIENINKNYYFDDKNLEQKNINKFVIFLLKNQLEFRIKKIENHLKTIEPLSYLFGIVWNVSIFLTFEYILVRRILSPLFQDSEKHPFLLSIFVFFTILWQSIFKTYGYVYGNSKAEKYQECLILLDEIEEINEIEMISGSSKEANMG